MTATTEIKGETEIKNLDGQKYVLTRTDDVFIYDEYSYLFHVTNLTKISESYNRVIMSNYKPTAEELIWIKKIENLEEQLQEHRNKRALNFLGSAVKFITGMPDHDDFIKMEEAINSLINNNEKQRLVNSRFERLIELLQGHESENHLIIEQVYEQLLLLVRTINAAKNNEYLSESLDMNDIREIVQHELSSIPIISVMEYADVHIARTKDTFIAIYKYPILNNKCKLFKVTPISFRHGKIQTDNQVAQCNKDYVRVDKCRNFAGINICQTKNETDTCILPLLDNRDSKCTVIQEYNDDLLEIEEGFILLNGNHTVDNITTTGVTLVTYTNQVIIDHKTYINIHDRIIEAIHTEHNEDFEIEKILNSNRHNAFNNIDSLRKLIIPYEEHPIRSGFYTLILITTIFGVIIIGLKIYKHILLCRRRQAEQTFRIYYQQRVENFIRDRDALV